MMSRGLCLIAARSADGVIGIDGRLPWRIAADWAHFAAVTAGHVLLSGRESFDETGVLGHRRAHVVLSRCHAARSRLSMHSDVYAAASLAEGLDVADALCVGSTTARTTFVCGGERVYAEALPLAERLILTTVHRTMDSGGDGDGITRFPDDWARYFPPSTLVSSVDVVAKDCTVHGGGGPETVTITLAEYSRAARSGGGAGHA